MSESGLGLIMLGSLMLLCVVIVCIASMHAVRLMRLVYSLFIKVAKSPQGSGEHRTAR